MPAFIDLTGKSFGRLIVIKRSYLMRSVKPLWECLCQCGKTTFVRGSDLKNGKTRSCGCLKDELVSIRFSKHKRKFTTEYNIWRTIKDRCLNPNNKSYKNYGGRGITICSEWKDSFETFYSDMGDRPKGFQIDRINNNEGYFADNCKWLSPSENCRNKRNNSYVLVNGFLITKAEASERAVVSDGVFRRRLDLGWDIDRALNTQLKSR